MVPYKPKLAFHCQQAQGSPTGIISGFTNVKELYQKIADCYDMEPTEVSQSHRALFYFSKGGAGKIFWGIQVYLQ